MQCTFSGVNVVQKQHVRGWGRGSEFAFSGGVATCTSVCLCIPGNVRRSINNKKTKSVMSFLRLVVDSALPSSSYYNMAPTKKLAKKK